MVVEVDTLKQPALEAYGPWLRRNVRLQQPEMEVDLNAAILRAKASLREKLPPNKGRCKEACLASCSSKRSSKSSTMSSPTSPEMASTPSPVSAPALAPSASPPRPTKSQPPPSVLSDITTTLSAFTFTHLAPPTTPFVFAPTLPALPQPRHGPKRPRPSNDVDGFDTAHLHCKKRRLRRHLITSRLSQPFSLPATHILNREAVATGDKRFLKLAAIANARRIAAVQQLPGSPSPPPGQGAAGPGLHHHSASEVLRRAAIINRFRLRVAVEAEQRGDEGVALIAGNAALLNLSAGLGGIVGPAAASAVPSVVVVPALPLPAPIPPQSHPHPLSRAAAVAKASTTPPGSPQSLRPVDVRGAGAAGLKLPSPVLAPLRPVEEDEDVDDGLCAFPTSEHESRYDSSDELDDVYADFSVIFSGGGSDVDSDEEGGYEEYLDELDGIPHLAR